MIGTYLFILLLIKTYPTYVQTINDKRYKSLEIFDILKNLSKRILRYSASSIDSVFLDIKINEGN